MVLRVPSLASAAAGHRPSRLPAFRSAAQGKHTRRRPAPLPLQAHGSFPLLAQKEQEAEALFWLQKMPQPGLSLLVAPLSGAFAGSFMMLVAVPHDALAASALPVA